MQLEATDRVNRRFAEYDPLRFLRADPEVTSVPARAGRQSTPDSVTGTTQLGANRAIGFPRDHQKDRIAVLVGIQRPRIDERFENVRRKNTSLGKILTHTVQFEKIRRGQTQLARLARCVQARRRYL